MDNIVFDNGIFPQANFLAFLLHQINGVAIHIPLPHAHLMSFIKVFQDTATCENHIIMNNQKEITLFIYEGNMGWLIEGARVDRMPQIQKIKIFCSSEEDRQYWVAHTQHRRGRIEEPFLHNELNLKLLLFGFDHLQNVYKCGAFADDNAIQNRLEGDRRRISQALAVYFLEKANSCNDRIAEGQECQS